ncbi:succinate dehydrogenase [Bifidobacterium asteroides]|nr:succinate dehydrogenase [Bifidobacterium asteroides]
MNPQKVRNRYDAVIVGAGAAGLSTALGLYRALESKKSKSDLSPKVLVVSKLQSLRSHTGSAEGGIAASLGNQEKDDWHWHYYDTVKGGDWLADQDAVRILAEQAPDIVIDLEHDGVAFSRTEDGHIAQRKFGGHTADYGGHPVRRAAYAADRIGHQILHALWQQCLRQGVEFAEEWYVTDLVVDPPTDEEPGGHARGLIVLDTHAGKLQAIQADNIVLCTGGAGRLFHTTSNSWDLTGDGMALALQAGLQLEDVEFIQFHPTGLGHTGILLSEASRAEGGVLRNSQGRAFMQDYAPEHGDLAARDVVSRSIVAEIDAGRGVADPSDPDGPHDCVWLDMTGIDTQRMNTLLPQVTETIHRYAHLDPTVDMVPVKPTAHYTMGGIPITDRGRVYRWQDGSRRIVDGLYAAGECSCVSVHGANRLGGNSLLDACLFGTRTGQTIATIMANADKPKDMTDAPTLAQALRRRQTFMDKLLAVESDAESSESTLTNNQNEESDPDDGASPNNPYALMGRLGRLMEEAVAVRCDQSSIEKGLRGLDQLDTDARQLRAHSGTAVLNQEVTAIMEVDNLLTLARAVLNASLKRKESRGALYRSDYPKRDDEHYLAHTMIDAREVVSWQPVHIVDMPPKGRNY